MATEETLETKVKKNIRCFLVNCEFPKENRESSRDGIYAYLESKQFNFLKWNINPEGVAYVSSFVAETLNPNDDNELLVKCMLMNHFSYYLNNSYTRIPEKHKFLFEAYESLVKLADVETIKESGITRLRILEYARKNLEGHFRYCENEVRDSTDILLKTAKLHYELAMQYKQIDEGNNMIDFHLGRANMNLWKLEKSSDYIEYAFSFKIEILGEMIRSYHIHGANALSDLFEYFRKTINEIGVRISDGEIDLQQLDVDQLKRGAGIVTRLYLEIKAGSSSKMPNYFDDLRVLAEYGDTNIREFERMKTEKAGN